MTTPIGDLLASVEQAAIVQPGDTLVLRVGHLISAAQAAQIRDHIEQRLTGVRAVIVQADDMAVYRPSEG